MSGQGSEPIVHLRGLKRGVLAKNPSAVATVRDRDLTHPQDKKGKGGRRGNVYHFGAIFRDKHVQLVICLVEWSELLFLQVFQYFLNIISSFNEVLDFWNLRNRVLQRCILTGLPCVL